MPIVEDVELDKKADKRLHLFIPELLTLAVPRIRSKFIPLESSLGVSIPFQVPVLFETWLRYKV